MLKKKLLVLLLSASMAMTMLAGCGSNTDKKDDTKPSTDKKEDTQPSTDKKNDTKPSTDKKDNTTVVNPTKPAKKAAKVGTKFVVAGQTYKVTKAGKEVSFIAAKKNAKTK